jgi:hypothetical protein
MEAKDSGTGGNRRCGDEIIHRLARYRLTPLGDEQLGRCIRSGGEMAVDGSQFMASD